MAAATTEHAMDTDFQWTDFALQSPSTLVELLDAAGLDGALPATPDAED